METTYNPRAVGSAEVQVKLSSAGGADWDARAKAAFLAIFATTGVDYRSGWLVLVGIASVPPGICLFMAAIYGLAWLMGKLVMRRRTTPTDVE